MKVTVIAWIGSTNLGDDLIFQSLIDLLDEFDIRREDITALSTDPSDTRDRFGVNSVGHLDGPAIFNAIRGSDLVVFGGGGLIQDETSAWNLPYYYSRLWLAKFLGKKIVAVGVGVGPLRTALGRWLTRLTFGKREALIVRDSPSGDQLSRLGIQNVTVGTDLVFGLPPVDIETAGYVAVSLRHYAPSGRYLPVGMRKSGPDEDMLNAIAKGLDEVADRSGLAIQFVSFDSRADVDFHARIAERMRASATFAQPTTNNVVEVMGAAPVVIATRFHAGVIATLTGRPSVLVGYSPKIHALKALVGDGCEVIPNEAGAFEDLAERALRVMEHGAEVRKRRHVLVNAFETNRSALKTLVSS